jgi:hypothetical protein
MHLGHNWISCLSDILGGYLPTSLNYGVSPVDILLVITHKL